MIHPSSSTRTAIPFTFTLLAAAVIAGCGARTQIANLMHDSWQILKEYERDGYTYFVVREGPRYTKIVQLPTGPVYTVYEVDTLTRNCKWGEVLIRCEGLQADPDLGGFLTWLRPAVPLPALPPPAPAAPPPPAPAASPPPPAPAPTGSPAEDNPYVTPPAETNDPRIPWD
jgi:hypothetical protein